MTNYKIAEAKYFYKCFNNVGNKGEQSWHSNKKNALVPGTIRDD